MRTSAHARAIRTRRGGSSRAWERERVRASSRLNCLAAAPFWSSRKNWQSQPSAGINPESERESRRESGSGYRRSAICKIMTAAWKECIMSSLSLPPSLSRSLFSQRSWSEGSGTSAASASLSPPGAASLLHLRERPRVRLLCARPRANVGERESASGTVMERVLTCTLHYHTSKFRWRARARSRASCQTRELMARYGALCLHFTASMKKIFVIQASPKLLSSLYLPLMQSSL